MTGREEIQTREGNQSDNWNHLYPHIREKRIMPFGRGWWKYAAAAVFLILIAGYYLFIYSGAATRSAGPGAVAERFKNDIPAPAGTHTILKLANGSQIFLDSVQNGTLTKQGNSNITKTGKDQLIYQSLNKKPAEAILYNTLSTAKGGRTSLVLADGSKICLNALSSLRFPTAFTGHERVVELTGEAYFEVAKNAGLPFQVKLTNGTKVQVLGTNFNIMAYADEGMVATTLLTGSVKLVKDSINTMLQPGQQAKLDKKGEINVTNTNVEEAVAWKNNLFWFNNTDMETVMRQVTRWYDVDVVFENKITKHFTGTVPKDVSIATLFKVLELSGGVHFTIKGRKIGVLE